MQTKGYRIKVEIETPRLHLQQFTLDDLEDLFLIRSDPEVMKFITGAPSTREQALAALTKYMNRWQTHDFGDWAVRFKNDSRLLGWCGLDFLETTREIEVGYGLSRPHWGQGVSTEAARASLEYGFDHLHLDRIVAVAYPENTASRHVMEKLGMKYVKNGYYYGGDLVYYEINRAEFPLSASNRILSDNS